jgi:hypothetical protein
VKESVHCDFFHDVFPGTSLVDEGESSRLYESLQDSYDDDDDSISDVGPAAPVPPADSDSEDAHDDSSISSTSSSHPIPPSPPSLPPAQPTGPVYGPKPAPKSWGRHLEPGLSTRSRAKAVAPPTPPSPSTSTHPNPELPPVHPESTTDVALLSRGLIPKSHKEALASEDCDSWMEAFQHELNMLQTHKTFELVPLPLGHKAIGSKWVMNLKFDEFGEVSSHRARVVAQGYSQQPGVDYFPMEIFAPVAQTASVRGIASYAAIKDYEIHVIDVKSAFLNSKMPDNQKLYVKQPPGFAEPGKEDWVWLLLKGLYGLKQAGRLWYEELCRILISLGFTVCTSDPCVFFRRTSNGLLIITSHVDDLALFASTLKAITVFKAEFKKHVNFTDHGDITQLLGMVVSRDRAARTISFSHKLYIEDILLRFRQSVSGGSSTPIEPGARLSKSQCPERKQDVDYMKTVPYSSAVGAVMHLAVMTRPDIAHAVQRVSQFMHNPGKSHWSAVQKLLKYLKSTKDSVLTLGGLPEEGQPLFRAYSDADFANSPDHGKSITGYALFLGRGCFSWSSKKQGATADSTRSAEYFAAHAASKEIIWFRQLSDQLGFNLTSDPTILYTDSNSAISNINTMAINSTNKHIKVSYHWIREQVQLGHIKTEWVPSKENVADVFTKGLPGPQHRYLVDKLGLINLAAAR